jgi:predicted neuraminidase
MSGYDDRFTYGASLIFDAGETWGQAREPVLRRMPDGSLLCLHYSGGPREPHDDNLVLVTRSQDDGETWSEAEILFDHPTRGVWATELFTDGNDAPCIFVHTLDATSHYLELKTFRSFSSDAGHTWSEPVSLPGGASSCSVRQGIVLRDGTWVFPIYWQEALANWSWEKTGPEYQPHNGWRFFAGVLRSDNCGRTFTLHGNLRADVNLWEPNIVETTPNRLIMLIRAAHGVLFRADSDDGGLTWSEPYATGLANPGTKLTLLSLGERVILINNANAKDRTNLSLWVSDDGGDTWRRKVEICPPDVRMFYPHGFVDHAREAIYVACEDAKHHFLTKIPFADVLD